MQGINVAALQQWLLEQDAESEINWLDYGGLGNKLAYFLDGGSHPYAVEMAAHLKQWFGPANPKEGKSLVGFEEPYNWPRAPPCLLAAVTQLRDVLVQGMPGVDMRSKTGDTLAVFGHAVFLNALAVAVGEAVGIGNSKDLVGGMDLGETQGIMVDATAKSITLLGAYDGGATVR